YDYFYLTIIGGERIYFNKKGVRITDIAELTKLKTLEKESPHKMYPIGRINSENGKFIGEGILGENEFNINSQH
ncbi:hypothetical protein HZA96_00755, partial [Candidatus Woesearchaeota archaeon]|nr:hypothetical protein [Candidatus Woesearchaeota archaeon]